MRAPSRPALWAPRHPGGLDPAGLLWPWWGFQAGILGLGAISSSRRAGLHKEKLKVELGSVGAGRWGDRGRRDVSLGGGDPGLRIRETPG